MLYSDFFEKCIYRTIKMTTINKKMCKILTKNGEKHRI